MEKVTVKCKTAVYGNVRAELLWANEPMSFWGTVDPQSSVYEKYGGQGFGVYNAQGQ